MPFTFSHPAAVLPLRWTRLPFAALVIGSMSPDFIYFLQFGPYSGFGHTLAGVFLLDLPLGVALYFYYRWRLRAFLLALLPAALQRRASGLDPLTAPLMWQVMLVVIAVLLGAGTHILWDAFTHAGAWGVEMLPVLSRQIEVAGRSIPLFKIAQHGSTFAGAGALLLWVSASFWRMDPDPGRQESELSWRLKHLVALALLSPIAGGCSAYLQYQQRDGSVGAYGLVVLGVVSAITMGFVYCCVASFVHGNTARA